MEILKDRVSVAELLAFRNSSNSVYIGNNVINHKNRETLRINLPDNADSIQFHHGLTDKSAIIKDGEILSTLPVEPGISSVVFSYQIPLKGQTEIMKKLNYFTSSQLILLSDNKYNTDVLGLSGGGSVEIKGQKFIKWSGKDLTKAHEISITIFKPVFGDDIAKWLVLLALIVIITVSVAYSFMFKKTNSSTSKDVNTKREDLIKYIAELDDRYEAGDIEQAEYKKLREETKDKLSS